MRCVCVCACVPAAVLAVHVMANEWKLHTLQVSCASEGEVAITVEQTEVLCQSAGQEVCLLQFNLNEIYVENIYLLEGE